MTAQEQETTVSDQEIFDHATAPEPKAEAPQEATPEKQEAAPEKAEESKSERVRDDKGRFAPKEPTLEAAPEQQEEPVAEKGQDHRVPLAELLNTRERAQKAEAEREQLRQALWQMQVQLKQMQTPKDEPVDMFAEPERWQQQYQQQMQAKMREMEGNMSLRLAAIKHGEDKLQEAYQWLGGQTQMGDYAAWQQVVNSPDPGETLIKLHKRDSVVAKVGDDPEAFVQKVLEEALNNPEYVARAVEKFKASASPQSQTTVKLPPSLNKATSAAPSEERMSSSEAAIWQYAISGR